VDGLFEMKKASTKKINPSTFKEAESRTKPTDSLSEPDCAG
jgi:hypothetical protein